MPTNKARLTISLTKTSEDLINSISKGSGISKSAVVNELCRLMGPALVHLTAAKQMMDAGLVNSSRDSIEGFLEGMKKDFSQRMEEAETSLKEHQK